MDKKYRRIIEMDSGDLYKKYLWNNSKREWLHLVLKKAFKRIKRPNAVLIIILLPLTSVSTLADGTSDKHFLVEQIMRINETLPLVEKAFLDIDKLGNSISKVAKKDPDTSFIFAFMITKWARFHNLDPNEVAAVIMTESRFDPKARSKKDARGLMQIYPKEWKMRDYFDVEENIKKGAQILYLFKKSNPGNYLDKYSGGEPGYSKEVTRNKRRLVGNDRKE